MSIFTTKVEQEVFYITFTTCLDQSAGNEIKQASRSWLATPNEFFIFDFSKVNTIDKSVYPIFVLFGRDLKSHKKFIFSLSVNPILKKQFKEMGLDEVFNAIDNIKEIYKYADKTPKKAKVDTDFIRPFIVGTQQAFGVQANTPIQPEKPFAKTAQHQPQIAIAGVINIVSNVFRGNIALCFPKEVFLAIYKNMIDEEHTEITPEIQDACGELLNILFGVAKAELNNTQGYEIEKALPTVLSGDKIKVQQTTALPVIVLPFKTPAGYFYLELVAEKI